MKKSLLVLLVLASLQAKAQTASLSPVDRQRVYEAILVLVQANAVQPIEGKKLQIDQSLVDDLIKAGILKPGQSEVAAICVETK